MKIKPNSRTLLLSGALGAALLTWAAGGAAQEAPLGVGPDPQLPEPDKSLIPTVHIAPAERWPKGVMPSAPAGFHVTALATGLDHPRWVYTLPNGDVLVAESNRPPS